MRAQLKPRCDRKVLYCGSIEYNSINRLPKRRPRAPHMGSVMNGKRILHTEPQHEITLEHATITTNSRVREGKKG